MKITKPDRGRTEDNISQYILNRKRKLSINMIRRLHEAMQIPADVLVQEYQCSKTDV
ncbi:hypothetical protein [Parapedobacter koreensis]|uniref:hypothetical protein n=1 Tax=Parapedobacter koreensis TaxID=332977 RepID=UPI0015A6DDB8|nr:hypothetical protein [Parapedobacter koreensis]